MKGPAKGGVFLLSFARALCPGVSMHCPHCQHENPPQAKFCLECGARFTNRCGSCGTDLPARAKFCLECGQAIGAAATGETRFTSPQAYTPKHLAEKIL